MNPSPIELVALDIAGTTVDEGQQVYRALEQTVVAHGADLSAGDIDRWHGADKQTAIRTLLTPAGAPPPSDDQLQPVFADFRARLARAYEARPPRPLPGVPEALAELREAGIRIALTTGFDHEILDALLTTLGWADGAVVDAVVSSSDVPAGRPAPYMIFTAMQRLGITDVARVLVAGDTPRDLEAGSNAGAAMVVGVLSGAGGGAQLGAQRHTHLVPSVADLPALLGLRTRIPVAA